MIKYKKGSIVPRWIGVKASDRKAQHKIKFGCDVSIECGVIYAESEGFVICAKDINRRMKNGTLKRVCVHIDGLRIDSSRVKNGAAFCFGAWNTKNEK